MSKGLVGLGLALCLQCTGGGGGGQSATPPPSTPVTVSLDVTSATFTTQTQHGFTATVAGNANTAVTWSLQEGSAGGSVDATGTYTASAAAGTYHVVATSVADPSKHAIATATVVPPPTISAFTASVNEVLPGQSVSLNATFANGTAQIDQGVGAVLSGVPMPTGALSANMVYVLTVTNAAGTSVSSGLSVAVDTAVSVAVFPAAATVGTGRSQAFAALVSGTSQTGLTYTVQEGAAGGSIDAAGLYTAPATPGTYHVVATSAFDASRSATAAVTVLPPPIISSFTASTSIITTGDGLTLSATFSGGTGELTQGLGLAVSGQAVPVSPVTPTTYTLVVTNAAGVSTSQSVSVDVVAPPTITALTSSLGSEIPLGASTTLTAAFSGGTGSLSPAPGTVLSGVGVPVTPGSSTTYQLTVTNAAGATATRSLSLTVDTQPFLVRSFDAYPSTTVDVGDEVSLRWTTSGGVEGLTLAGSSVLGSTSAPFTPALARQDVRLSGFNRYGGDSRVLSLLARGAFPFVGHAEGPGYVGGTLVQARYCDPIGVAYDAAGNVYVADAFNHVIRRIGTDGLVQVVAGKPQEPGSADGGALTEGRLNTPHGVAVDASGTIYIADTYNAVIRKLSGGVLSTFAGFPGAPGHVDATGAAARFDTPYGLSLDGAGNLYVGDGGNTPGVRMVTPAGVVTTLAGGAAQGYTDGTGPAAHFRSTLFVAYAGGNVYVADFFGRTIRKVVVATGVTTTFAGLANQAATSVDGVGGAARFGFVAGIATDGTTLYVGDVTNSTLRKVDLASATVTTFVGQPGARGNVDGTGGAARIANPWGLAWNGSTTLAVAEVGNEQVRQVQLPAGTISAWSGQPTVFGAADGSAATATFARPTHLTYHGGAFYVADANNFTLRKVLDDGTTTTLAGSPGLSGTTDGTGSAARFTGFGGIVFDPSDGSLYVSDLSRHIIRKVTSAGVVTTIAGLAGSGGFMDGTGSAARFASPGGLALDGSGNLYVADSNNALIRKIVLATAAVTTIAGGGPSVDDPSGLNASFYFPFGLAYDGLGSLYVGDSVAIRKVNVASTAVTTVAGTAFSLSTGAQDGTGAAAAFGGQLDDLAMDADGSLLILDPGNGLVRRMTPGGVVTTRAGRAGVFAGVSAPQRLSAPIYAPAGLALGPSGDLFLTTVNGIVRLVFQ